MIGVIFKRYIYIFIYIALIGATALNADTGQKLKAPSSNSFDFTFNQDFQKETQVDKTLIEIGKTTVLDRRLNNLFYCKTDKNGTEYCPEGLAKARDYTAYSDGGYLENTGQITDYTNGTSVSNKGQVIDYIKKKPEEKIQVYDNWRIAHGNIWAQCKDGVYTDSSGAKTSSPYYGMRVRAYPYFKQGKGSSGWWRHSDGQWNGLSQQAKIDLMARQGHKIQTYGSCCADLWRLCKKESIDAPKCPSGYTATTGAETSKGECKKTVDFYYYEYICPAEYKPINKGLKGCVKQDTSSTSDNTAVLEQPCNNSTPPAGNCEKPISFKYYEYICEGKNAFDQGYTVVDKGMTSCTKTDTDNTKPNSNLANACNSSTPPKNNCKSTEFTCDSTLFKPVFVDGKWQCSPFVCDGTMKCGYGTCPANTTPSLDKYMSPAYNPLRYAFSNKCNTPLCDYVFNRDVSYCERKACPVGDDIIEQNGKCYKLECPAGTYLSGDKCITGKY